MKLDRFKLITYQNIDIDERNVVTLLYQPLIGCRAFSLYTLLWSLIDRSRLKSPEYLHGKIFDLLTLTPDEFLKARKTLEAIGLLVVYQNEEMFLYELKAPVTAEEFIKDGSLGAYLYHKIGQVEFDEISSLFRISNTEKDGFKNITTNFDEVFETIPKNIETNGSFLRRSKSKITINHDFDWDIFLEGLSKNFVDRRKLTNKIKEQITHFSYVYELDESSMQRAYMDSVDNDKNVNLDKLNKRCKYWASVVQNTLQDTMKETEYEHIDVTVETIKELCLKHNPKDLLIELTGSKPSKKELETIFQVESELDLPKEVINFLLLYAFQSTDGNLLPGFSFINTIYTSWIRDGVKTFEDAYNATLKYKETSNKRRTNKNQKKFEPDWVTDMMKEF